MKSIFKDLVAFIDGFTDNDEKVSSLVKNIQKRSHSPRGDYVDRLSKA